MTEAEVYAGLTEIFHEAFIDDSIVLRPDMTAKDVPGWDSFNHINIVVAAEERFGIRLGSKEVEGMRNVGDFVAAILAKAA